MSVSLPEGLQQLTNRMLRKKLFLVTMTAEVARDRLIPHLADQIHDGARQAWRVVRITAARECGRRTSGDLSIFNSSRAEEARSFAGREPFYVHGLRKFEVKEWMLMEGSMTVTLNFAERTLDVA